MEKTIKMTSKEIDDTLALLNVLLKQINEGTIVVHDPKFSYVLGRNIRILKTENIDFVDAKNSAMREYGEYYEDHETGDAGFKLDIRNTEQVKRYEQKVKEVGSIVHEITVFAVPMSVVEQWDLPFSIKTMLWFLVEDGDEF